MHGPFNYYYFLTSPDACTFTLFVLAMNMQSFYTQLEPWKRFEGVNVHDTSEVIKMLHEVSTTWMHRTLAWNTIKQTLMRLPHTSSMVTMCDERMLRWKDEKISDDSDWKAIARAAQQAAMQEKKELLDMTTGKLNAAVIAYRSAFELDDDDDVENEEGEADYGAVYVKMRREIRMLKKLIQGFRAEHSALNLREKTSNFTESEIADAKMQDKLVKSSHTESGDSVKWNDIMREVLKSVLQASSDRLAEIELQEVCRKRMEATVVEGITELKLAEDLVRELAICNWGSSLYQTEASVKAESENKAELIAWQIFYNSCSSPERWGYLADTNRINASGRMTKVTSALQQENRTIISALREGRANMLIVAPAVAKKARAMKTTRVTHEKGAYSKTAEEQEPVDENHRRSRTPRKATMARRLTRQVTAMMKV